MAGPECADTIFCIMAMKRFWSILPRSAMVWKCAVRAGFSIFLSSALPVLVRRQS